MRREGEQQGPGEEAAPRVPENPTRSPESLMRAWRWWAGPALAALALALVFADPFIGDWDGLDYTLASIEGRPSSMALGRSLFIFANHAAYSLAHFLFGLSAEGAYLLFKYMVVAQSPLAVIACWVLARDATDSARVATIAALLVATSPFFVIYSGQVMTEIPSLLMVAAALTIYLRGVRRRSLGKMLLGAFILGAGVNVREPVAFYALWLVVAPAACGWRLKAQELTRVILCLLVFAVIALGPFAYWFLSDSWGYRSAWYGWRESMRVETARHPFGPFNVVAFLIYFFLAAPLIFVAMPAAFFREWRANKFSRALALASVGLVSTLLLLLNYSTTINWRYFLTGLPALAPLAAFYLLRSQEAGIEDGRRAFAGAVAGVLFIAVVLGLFLKPSRDKFTAQHAAMKEYRERLMAAPTDAVMISGSQSIAVTYWRGIGLGRWEVVGAGSGWPGDKLADGIEKYLSEGKRVFLDADPRFWPVCGWQETETRELVLIEPRFRFRRVSDYIYELRPVGEAAAADAPGLKSLLPENRPADLSKCTGIAKG